eukprot:g8039.t1 g8039   contig27:52813-53142(-)
MSCDLFLAPQPIIENDPKSIVSCPKAIQFNHQRQTELILAIGDDIDELSGDQMELLLELEDWKEDTSRSGGQLKRRRVMGGVDDSAQLPVTEPHLRKRTGLRFIFEQKL